MILFPNFGFLKLKKILDFRFYPRDLSATMSNHLLFLVCHYVAMVPFLISKEINQTTDNFLFTSKICLFTCIFLRRLLR